KAYGYSIYYSKKNLENLDIDNLNEVYENIVETYDLEVGDTLYATISGLEFETNYYFTIDAYDYSSNRSELASVINVKTKENTAPIINPLNGLKLTQKAFETKYLNFSFLDPDGHNVAWSLVPGSSAATASLVNNIIEVKIVGRDAPAGTYIGKIVVTDEYGASSYVEFVYKIEENQPPIVVNPLANIYISSLGKEVVLDVANVFEDPDGEPLTYIASSDAPTLVQVTQNLNSIVITSLSYGLANLTVLAKDALGATVESSFKVLVRNNSNEIDLYPNPVRDILNLRVGEETTAQVSLISGVGATVFNKQTNIGPFNPLQIDMSSMSGGVYTVIAKFGGKELKYNIIKL
ncbi:MAG: T9SS type A sorting domain-containing protein, partial [Bacteroidales bacterium]